MSTHLTQVGATGVRMGVAIRWALSLDRWSFATVVFMVLFGVEDPTLVQAVVAVSSHGRPSPGNASIGAAPPAVGSKAVSMCRSASIPRARTTGASASRGARQGAAGVGEGGDQRVGRLPAGSPCCSSGTSRHAICRAALRSRFSAPRGAPRRSSTAALRSAASTRVSPSLQPARGARIAARAAANQQPDAAFHLSGGPQATGDGLIEWGTERAPGVAAMRAMRSAPRVAKGVAQIVALERATARSRARAGAGAPTRSPAGHAAAVGVAPDGRILAALHERTRLHPLGPRHRRAPQRPPPAPRPPARERSRSPPPPATSRASPSPATAASPPASASATTSPSASTREHAAALLGETRVCGVAPPRYESDVRRAWAFPIAQVVLRGAVFGVCRPDRETLLLLSSVDAGAGATGSPQCSV